MHNLYQDFLYNYEVNEVDGTANIKLNEYNGAYIPIYYKENGACFYDFPKYIPISELQLCLNEKDFLQIVSYFKKRSIVIIYNDLTIINNLALNRILMGTIKAYVNFFMSFGLIVYYESK